jgi:hypothetical protein
MSTDKNDHHEKSVMSIASPLMRIDRHDFYLQG